MTHAKRDQLVQIERDALAAQLNHDYIGAAALWETLLKEDPEWEHGIAHLSLAQCYCELNHLGEAERLFEEAVRREPSLPHLGSYASFLFEHKRDTQRALSMLLQTLQLEAFQGDGSTGSTEPLLCSPDSLAFLKGRSRQGLTRQLRPAELDYCQRLFVTGIVSYR